MNTRRASELSQEFILPTPTPPRRGNNSFLGASAPNPLFSLLGFFSLDPLKASELSQEFILPTPAPPRRGNDSFLGASAPNPLFSLLGFCFVA